MNTIYNILIVEDDEEIGDAVEIYLRNQGYRIFKGHNGYEGLEIIKNQTIHLAIVDIMMPKMDGITMVMNLRTRYDFPVIMLSAKSEEIDKITGLNIGADDYITKPFNPMELIARVNSHLRRYEKYLKVLGAQKKNILTVGGLELDIDKKEVMVDGQNVRFTPKVFNILYLLMRNPGVVFSSEEIYERVWNEEAINCETVMVHIRNIREKIEVNPKKPNYLKVVWGVGYKIEKF